MSKSLRVGLIAVSIVVAALATWLWLRTFEVSQDEVAGLFARLNWWLVLPLVALMAAHVTLASWRWSLIDRGLGGPHWRLRETVAVGALAVGLGTFLPSPLTTVACRSLASKISGTSALRGAVSGGIDQVADFATVLLLAGPAALAMMLGEVKWYFILSPLAILAGVGLILTAPGVYRAVLTAKPSASGGLAILADRHLLLTIYGLSLLRVGNLILMTLFIHWMTGAASVMAVVIGVPLVTVAISLAMLPGAFGISEWSFSAVFSMFGIPSEEIVLFVLANRFILTALSLSLAAVASLAMLRWGREATTARPSIIPSDKSL